MTPPAKTPSTSSSMEEVAAKRPEEVRPPTVKKEPPEAHASPPVASPPQSALRANSSSIEEERGAKSWLRRRAREMRKEMTPHEKAMWRLLHEGELMALNWRRQATFGNYILDFVSHSARLVIEVDGSQHAVTENVESDAERTEWLRTEGYTVLRFWNHEAVKARDDVWRTIHATAANTPAKARMQRWRDDHMAQIQQANAQITSSSMEEVAAKRPEEVRPPTMKKKPPEALSQSPLVSPPQSALRADSSSIEEERS